MMKFIFVILITGFWGVDRISMTEVSFLIENLASTHFSSP